MKLILSKNVRKQFYCHHVPIQHLVLQTEIIFAYSYGGRCNCFKRKLVVFLLTLLIFQCLFFILPGWHFILWGGKLFYIQLLTRLDQGYSSNLDPITLQSNQSLIEIMENKLPTSNLFVQLTMSVNQPTKSTLVKFRASTTAQLPLSRMPFALSFTPKFIINNENTCTSKVDVIVCVHSHPKHKLLRNTIRQTWSNQTNWPFHRIKTLFFVGLSKDYLPNNETVQHALSVESDFYNDIIQVNYMDTYRNLTFKALSVLHWLSTYCANSTYVLKVDDDVIVNSFSLQRNHMTLGKNPIGERQIACMALHKYGVMRKGKWSVTKQEMPDVYYPTYCSGMGYLMLTSTAVALYEAVPLEPLFWIDDVYVTGFLAQRINTTFRMTKATWNEKASVTSFTGTGWKQFYFGHAKKATTIEKVWSRMLIAEFKNETTRNKLTTKSVHVL